jgi:predicted nucleotidyltransferase
MNFGLSNKQYEQINSLLCANLEIESVVIYGSRAKGTHKPYSDVDLTIIGKNISLTILQKIELELDDLLLPFKFDLSVFSTIENTELLEHISRIGKVFYEKK